MDRSLGTPEISTFGAKDKTWGSSRQPFVESALKFDDGNRKGAFLTISSLLKNNILVNFCCAPKMMVTLRMPHISAADPRTMLEDSLPHRNLTIKDLGSAAIKSDH